MRIFKILLSASLKLDTIFPQNKILLQNNSDDRRDQPEHLKLKSETKIVQCRVTKRAPAVFNYP